MSEKKFYAGIVDIFDKDIKGNPEKSCEMVISDTVPEITHDSWFFRETACNANGRMRKLLEKDGRVIDGRELVEMTGEVALLEHNAVANPKVRDLFGLKDLGWGNPQHGNSDEKQDETE